MPSRIRAIAAELAAASARDEALAEYVPARRMLGFPRAATMRPIGRVWRLGAFLITPDGKLLATGRAVRVANTERMRSVVAASITEHHELARAAARGGYRLGETVNFDARPVDPERPGIDDLEAYLADRAELLLHPPGSEAGP